MTPNGLQTAEYSIQDRRVLVSGGSPQVRIAVMDADGTNVVQLTNVSGTSRS